MRPLQRVVACFAILALAQGAFAHGGSFRGGNGDGSGGPPPGPADDATTAAGWETWWANDRARFFRRMVRPRARAVATTPGGDATKPPPKDPAPEDRNPAPPAHADLQRREVVSLFIAALDDPSTEVRSAAAIALGKTGDASGLGPLVAKSRSDPEREIRDTAVLALGILGQEPALETLAQVLTDEGATTHRRSFAAFALGLLGGRDAAQSLVGFMTAPTGLRHRGDPPLHGACFLAMGITGDDTVLPTLWSAGADTSYDDQVRAFAWSSLGRMHDRTSLAMFVRALENPVEKVALRHAAARSLRNVAKPGDSAAVAALVNAMRTSTDPLTRRLAAMSLAEIGGDRTVFELRTAFTKAEDADRGFLALALAVANDRDAAPMIRKALLAGGSESFRGGAATALGLLGDAGSRDVLEAQVAARGAIWPQGYAALALGMAGIVEARPVLRNELERANDPRLRVNLALGLALLDDPSMPGWLVDTFRNPRGTTYSRGAAAMSLGLLRYDESVPLLAGVACDSAENEMLRAYAVAALGILMDRSDPPRLASLAAGQDDSLQNDALAEVLTIY